ncbi:hypothetical protein [Geobacter sp. DSM 9736]|uniref:hypothetical protein n=1 Tax=Geobacter sp. DSM 9736 TaxID=1277350 RepID=UPI000B512087|nr:hypothetical protein [Geobacter sp. DSM 9736]SNB44901.1 hypothetical protein SAMN06269301_0291 [Geobacter sp. DSM 9736]
MARVKRYKFILFSVLLLVTLGLVSHGTRVPNLKEVLSSSAKPKPRPRAVVKTQIKACQESIKKHCDPSPVLLNRQDPAAAPVHAPVLRNPDTPPFFPLVVVSSKPSRASPRIFLS